MSPGQEAEPLAGLDGRPREDHPRDLPVLQRGDGYRHREVRLAGACRPDPEGDRAVPDRFDVALLRHGLRRDLLAAVSPDDVAEDGLHVLGLVDRVQHGVDRPRPDLLAGLDELDELVHDRPRLGHMDVVARDCEPVPAQENRALQPVTERVEDAVADRRQLRGDVVGDVECLLHLLHALSVGAGSRVPSPARPAFPSPAG